jgi:hypothetical protein
MHISHHTAQEIAREYQRERITQARRHDASAEFQHAGERDVDSRRFTPSFGYVQRCWRWMLRRAPVRRSA